MEKLVKRISNIGLTENEAKIYYFLIKHNGKTASELSKNLKINRTNVYGILSGLVSKGLCKEVAGKATKYFAISPKESFELIKDDLENKIKEINELSKILLPLYNNSSRDNKLVDFIEILHTKASISQKIGEIEDNATKSVLLFGKFPYIHKVSANDNEPCPRKEGVEYKFIFEIDDEGRYDVLAKMFKKDLRQVRIIEHLPIKMIVTDEKFIIFSVVNECTNQLTTVFISNTELGKLMTEIFEIYWERAKEY